MNSTLAYVNTVMWQVQFIFRHVYHTAGLTKALKDVIAKPESKEKLQEFQMKYSIYTYHVMMAIHALKNPFINKGHVKNEKELDPTE